jgi:nucleotide-binding universal stress UspA family protein
LTQDIGFKHRNVNPMTLDFDGTIAQNDILDPDVSKAIGELRGKSAFRRLLLGSVTAKVLHDAECAVWSGKHVGESPAIGPTEMNHVMCAVDFGPQSVKALRWAADFASEFGAKLTVVHAVLAIPPNLPERYMFQWHDEATGGAETRLGDLLLTVHIQANILIADGETTKVLSNALQQQDAGLLVMGRSCVPDGVDGSGVMLMASSAKLRAR